MRHGIRHAAQPRLPLLLLLLISALACGTDRPALTTPPAPPPTAPAPAPAAPVVSALTVLAGDRQSGYPQTVLPTPLQLRATTAAGAPVAGATIAFDVEGSGATVTPARVVSGADGTASATVTLSGTGGTVTVRATAQGTILSARFALVVRAPERDSTAAPAVFNPDWTTASHANGVAPDYAAVFPQDAVSTLELELTSAQWAAIRADMQRIHGFDFGARPGGAGSAFVNEDPLYVAVTARLNGRTWRKVGFRLKGNSTLVSAWGQGNWKLPFRLHLDKFEDTYPAIRNQRLYGFQELSFSNGRNDPSLLHDKLAADLFRQGGVPAARTAFFRVFIDYGDGPRYAGLYTGVEVIDDTMIRNQFGEDAGNIYKPESRFLTFTASQFEKKNNQTNGFDDVQAFIRILNDPLRSANPATWRGLLEATFDVPHFLRWLAINTAIVNWDSYGAIAHNHYLYHHSRRRLVWIPWDHNEAFTGSPGITGPFAAPPGGPRPGLSLSMNEVSGAWPLIRHLMDDPVYAAQYRAHVRQFNAEVLSQPALMTLVDRYTALIAPHVVGPAGEQPGATHLPSAAAWNAAAPALKQHLRARSALVSSWVP